MGTFRSKAMAGMLAAAVGLSGAMLAGPADAAGYAYNSGYSGYAFDDDEPSGGKMLADAVIVRPMTFVASAIGAVGWVVSLPFTVVGGNMESAGRTLVVDPLQYTFVRPLGYMEDKTPPFGPITRTDEPHGK